MSHESRKLRRLIGAKCKTDPDHFPLQTKDIINISNALTMERRMLLDGVT